MQNYPDIPPEFAPYLWTGGAGMLGRLMYRAKLAQQGLTKPLDWGVLWDVCIALGMGWMALGICLWLEIIPEATTSVAIITGYLGPYGLDLLFVRWVDSKFQKLPEGKKEQDNA